MCSCSFPTSHSVFGGTNSDGKEREIVVPSQRGASCTAHRSRRANKNDEHRNECLEREYKQRDWVKSETKKFSVICEKIIRGAKWNVEGGGGVRREKEVKSSYMMEVVQQQVTIGTSFFGFGFFVATRLQIRITFPGCAAPAAVVLEKFCQTCVRPFLDDVKRVLTEVQFANESNICSNERLCVHVEQRGEGEADEAMSDEALKDFGL